MGIYSFLLLFCVVPDNMRPKNMKAGVYMCTFKDTFYKSIKEKADPTLHCHYHEERTILNDDLITFYGMISKDAKEFFESYIQTQIGYLGEIEKEYIYDFTFLELNKVWREVVIGGVEPIDFMREDV